MGLAGKRAISITAAAVDATERVLAVRRGIDRGHLKQRAVDLFWLGFVRQGVRATCGRFDSRIRSGRKRAGRADHGNTVRAEHKPLNGFLWLIRCLYFFTVFFFRAVVGSVQRILWSGWIICAWVCGVEIGVFWDSLHASAIAIVVGMDRLRRFLSFLFAYWSSYTGSSRRTISGIVNRYLIVFRRAPQGKTIFLTTFVGAYGGHQNLYFFGCFPRTERGSPLLECLFSAHTHRSRKVNLLAGSFKNERFHYMLCD